MRSFLIGVGIALMAVLVWAQNPVEEPAFQVGYEATDPIGQVLYKSGDGQIMARLAQDPLMTDPHRIHGQAETAYRWQRPVPIWSAWLLSFGNPNRTAAGLFAAMVLGTGLLCWELTRHGVPTWAAALFLVTPGILSNYRFFGPEAFGLALILYGWRTGKVWPHIIAGLVRETFLLPSLALAVMRRDIRHLTPTAVFLGWAVVVNERTGGWFWWAQGSPGHERLGGFPVWAADRPTLVVLVVSVGLVVWMVRRLGPEHPAAFASVAYLMVLAVLGPDVWQSWKHVGRVLSPVYALALVHALAEQRRITFPRVGSEVLASQQRPHDHNT